MVKSPRTLEGEVSQKPLLGVDNWMNSLLSTILEEKMNEKILLSGIMRSRVYYTHVAMGLNPL
jgi:hypothetical protein